MNLPTRPQPRLWDISAPVATGSPVFPGDTAYQQQWGAQINDTCPVNVGMLTLSPHVGTHADAPLHYDPTGQTVGEVDLATYIGPCRVIHAIGCGPLIQWQHLVHAIGSAATSLPARVLVRTYAKAPIDRWDPALTAFSPDTVEHLAERGVRLIGIDTASIDPADSKTLDSHQVIRRHDMRVLENLVLDNVPEGDYELIALPLKLMQADASPVRAVLRSLPSPLKA
ncbi:MAG: arylformamidase [Betaproteobacteria bacterium]|nr:arylformamidase [Betaproteobacteria bacterium]